MRQKGSGHPCAPGRDPFRGRARFLKHLLKANHVRIGHALIQLGLAYEVDSKEIAMEALALASVQKDFLYDYSSDSSLNKISSISSDSILDLLDLIGVQRRGAG
ncbi:hypothetical protein E4U45_007159 [Claviceps purpurea]|nr:hypothetical protein E4U45_007159 [Claviceps purpurea]